jgi:hypothetical protein
VEALKALIPSNKTAKGLLMEMDSVFNLGDNPSSTQFENRQKDFKSNNITLNEEDYASTELMSSNSKNRA